MPDDVLRFNADLDRWAEETRERLRLRFVALCLDAFAKVVEKTPVDTGFCRASWAFSINRLPAFKINNPTSGRASGSEEGYHGAEATKGNFAPSPYATLTPLRAQLGDVVYIYNPVIYALSLEYGHSQQAPNGMVAVTLAELAHR